VTPPTVLAVGTDANLTCSLTYGAPTTDPADVTQPLGVNQNPTLTLLIDDVDLPGIEFFTSLETTMGERTKILVRNTITCFHGSG